MELTRGITPGTLDCIIAAAASCQEKNSTDYVNPDDGLLYCGKCRTPKQFRLEIPNPNNNAEPRVMIVPVICKCQSDKIARQEQRQKAEEDIRRLEEMRQQSLMDEKFRQQTFSNFRETAANGRVLKLCRRYADNFDEMLKKNQGLLFYGDVGSGKTYAAACIANQLLEQRKPVMMTSFVKLLQYASSSGEDENQLIYRMNRASLLIIDDLGAERSTEYALEKVYKIIDSRYRCGKPIILTTNLSLKDMQQADDIRYRRVYDRIFEMCYPLEFKGESFRKSEARKRFDDMRQLLEG